MRTSDRDAPTPTDDELMLAVQDGRLDRLGELFERHHVRLFNFLLRLTGNRAVAEDLVQEAFMRALHYRHTYRGGGSFVPWMYQVARNVSADHFRRHARELPLDEPEEGEELREEAPAALERLERSESVALLRRALMELPVDKREVLVLARFEMLPYKEIARLLDTTVGAIKVRVHRAVKQLRDRYRALAREAFPLEGRR